MSGLFYAIILAGHIKLIVCQCTRSHHPGYLVNRLTERILCTTTFPTLYFPLADCQHKIRCCCLIFACLLFISLKSTSSANFCCVQVPSCSSSQISHQISHEYSRHRSRSSQLSSTLARRINKMPFCHAVAELNYIWFGAAVARRINQALFTFIHLDYRELEPEVNLYLNLCLVCIC